MNYKEWKEHILKGHLGETLQKLYGSSAKAQEKRYLETLEYHYDHSDDVFLFSTPGRTELCGNHTDHNNGKVLASSVQSDIIAFVKKRRDPIIKLESHGFDKSFTIDLHHLEARNSEGGTTESILRGTIARLKMLGYQFGGFEGYIHSQVPSGSGLSSSAAIEILIGTIENKLYNNSELNPIQLAEIAQWVENHYFMKPCGLMDQMACAIGGIIAIDFQDPKACHIEQLSFNFIEHGYVLCVTNTGGSHANLTADYAGIPQEMMDVAEFFNNETLRGIKLDQLIQYNKEIRQEKGDRAFLRAYHYISENHRVDNAVNAIKASDIQAYLETIEDSGESSWKYLQNCHSAANYKEQGITLALLFSSSTLQGKGVSRVHGGGFAGTIQAYVPIDVYSKYVKKMENIFGPDCVIKIPIRSIGTTELQIEKPGLSS